MPSQFLIVGLGNPGVEYERTRHNVGFWVLDALQQRWRLDAFRSKFGAEWTKGKLPAAVSADAEVVLAKPQTYMNRSGEPTQALAQFFKIPPEQVLVVHDELDFEPGVVRLKVGGGAGGHNGLRSLIACIGADFVRLRLGVGKPRSAEQGAGHVLGVPPKAEQALLDEGVVRSVEGIERVLALGPGRAMTEVNRK